MVSHPQLGFYSWTSSYIVDDHDIYQSPHLTIPPKHILLTGIHALLIVVMAVEFALTCVRHEVAHPSVFV